MKITKAVVRGLSAAVLMLAATPAFAADATPDAHKLELAKRFIAAGHMDRMAEAIAQSMGRTMDAEMATKGAALTPDQRAAISEAFAGATKDMMLKMPDLMAPLYADNLTEKELEDLVAFYESPTGQSAMTKLPTIMRQMTPMMLQLVPQMQADMHQRLCAKTDCAKLGTLGRAPPAP